MCLHYAAGYGHEECVESLLTAGGDPEVQDAAGDVPLHFAAVHGHPMCAYTIAKVSNQQRSSVRVRTTNIAGAVALEGYSAAASYGDTACVL
jgi:ankyrin repeat protein